MQAIPHKACEFRPILRIVVPGIPQTKGSTRSVWSARHRKILTFSTNKRLKDWSKVVRHLGALEVRGQEPRKGPVGVRLRFLMPEPKGKPSEPVGDIDKLLRAALDPLTGLWWVDDRQVVAVEMIKLYDSTPRLELTAYMTLDAWAARE